MADPPRPAGPAARRPAAPAGPTGWPRLPPGHKNVPLLEWHADRRLRLPRATRGEMAAARQARHGRCRVTTSVEMQLSATSPQQSEGASLARVSRSSRDSIGVDAMQRWISETRLRSKNSRDQSQYFTRRLMLGKVSAHFSEERQSVMVHQSRFYAVNFAVLCSRRKKQISPSVFQVTV